MSIPTVEITGVPDPIPVPVVDVREEHEWAAGHIEGALHIPLGVLPVRAHELAMRGTSQARPHCIALDADIGHRSRCTIHARRPAACAQVPASWEFGAASDQCDRARAAHGLPPLVPSDWTGVDEGDRNPLPRA